MINKHDRAVHNGHRENIMQMIGYDKWVDRNTIEDACQTRSLTARISEIRKRYLTDASSTLICLVTKGKTLCIRKTYYAIVPTDLLDNPSVTTYGFKTLPDAVKKLIGLPEEKTDIKTMVSQFFTTKTT